MQDVEKNNLSTSIRSAASFLNAEEASSLTELVAALERVYINWALDLKTNISDEQAANRLIRIAIPLESQLYHLKNNNSQDILKAYAIVASIFEYAARVKTSPSESSQFWLRASLAYLQAKKSANSIVCARRARITNGKNKGHVRDQVLQTVSSLLTRDIHEINKSKTDLKSTLELSVTRADFSSIMEQAQTSGLLDLVISIHRISEYLEQGLEESGNSWIDFMRNALAHFQESGDDYLVWLTSRLFRATSSLRENALWNLRDLVPSEVISSFTLHKTRPIYDLWDNQLQAIRNLLGPEAKRHYSLIMPTSAGKTIVGVIVAAIELLKHPGFCFYVTPYKALVNEVAQLMDLYLPQIGINVSYLPGKYDSIPELETVVGNNARMYILTPEKLDLLWRLNDPRLKSAIMFIFDEIQNIVEEGRGLRYELVVSRIKKSYSRFARILLLSAVIPEGNLITLINWLGSQHSDASKINWKPTRTLDAVFWRAKLEGFRGDLHYVNKFNIFGILPPKENPTRREDASDLALKYEKRLGPVLVYCSSKDETEHMAAMITKKARIDTGDSHDLKTASEHVRSIMGPNYPLAELIEKGIAYHHASLPDSVKKIIENLGRQGSLRIICCTSTLAEGVNLSVGTVIISSTFQGDVSMDGLKLRNLAGRAGRALKDTEGHVILMDAAARQSLTDDAYAVFESRFFQYLSAISRIGKFDTDVDAIESDLLARFYKHELVSDQLEEGTKAILDSTLFARQANVQQYKSALASLENHAKRVSTLIPLLNENELKVFAETGLGIRHCQILNDYAKGFSQNPNLRFRINAEVNWKDVLPVLEACLLPSSRYGARIQQTVTQPLKVMQEWLLGKSVVNIASIFEDIPSRRTLTAISSFLYGYVADDVSWANAALIKLIDRNIIDQTKKTLDYEFYLLPSYLKYGVSTPSALLLSMAGLEDRDYANKIASKYPMEEKVDWLRIISWILDLNDTNLEKAKSNILSNLSSFSVEIENFSGMPGSCELGKDGQLIQMKKPIGNIPKPYHSLFRVTDARECTFFIITEKSKAFLHVNPA